MDGGLLRLIAGGGGAPGRGEPRERGAEARLDDAAFIAHFAGRRIDPSLPGSLAGALRMYGA
ncbi:MAG: hypothetical protein E6I76_19395 [Chloroflexi bacterium]|nr:MAG: hypothetical protein E6I76_19395 [Chloroflexota bacterium]